MDTSFQLFPIQTVLDGILRARPGRGVTEMRQPLAREVRGPLFEGSQTCVSGQGMSMSCEFATLTFPPAATAIPSGLLRTLPVTGDEARKGYPAMGATNRQGTSRGCAGSSAFSTNPAARAEPATATWSE